MLALGVADGLLKEELSAAKAKAHPPGEATRGVPAWGTAGKRYSNAHLSSSSENMVAASGKGVWRAAHAGDLLPGFPRLLAEQRARKKIETWVQLQELCTIVGAQGGRAAASAAH